MKDAATLLALAEMPHRILLASQGMMPPDDIRHGVEVFLPPPDAPASTGSAGLGAPLVCFGAEVLMGHAALTRDAA